MIRIAVILGSTRPGRRGATVAEWVRQAANRHKGIESGAAGVEVVDLADFGLPLLDEPVPAIFGEYSHAHTQRWAATIGSYDGFIFVTPEYNHAVPAALKNAIDFLFAEWNNKAAGFVSYGVHGGTRAVEQLRLAMAELGVADVRSQVALSVFTDFQSAEQDITDPGVCVPAGHHESTLHELLDELIAWSAALKPLRAA
ncbi:MAG: NAD(P)H-dependent oxidoreductase [Actinoplanes sp.]